MSEAAKVVASAIIGSDVQIIVVDGKRYVLPPPVINRIAGAITCLCEAGLPDKPSIRETLLGLKNTPVALAKSLSWFVKGDESLTDEFTRGSFEEVVSGVEQALSLISTSVFLKAVSLARNAASLAAKPKL